MPITDLTNTMWVIDKDLSQADLPTGSWIINFYTTSDLSVEEQGLNVSYQSGIRQIAYDVDYPGAYNSDGGGWDQEWLRLVKIVDGQDVEDPDLIDFFTTYATQITGMIDVSNTCWVFNNNIGSYLTNHKGTFGGTVYFTAGSTDHWSIGRFFTGGTGLYFDSDQVASPSGWVGTEAEKTIFITEADPEAEENLDLLALLYGAADFKYAKYKLGWKIAPTGYQVQLLFNESDLYAKRGVYVYDGQTTSGTLLFQDTTTSATPSTTVTCTSGSLCVYFSGPGGQMIVSNVTIISGMVTTSWNGGVPVILTVNGDGAVRFTCAYDD